MYATIARDIPGSEGWTFEPKYDGVRVLAHVADNAVRLITRNGNDKTKQFPEIADALRALTAKARHPFVADGEIIAILDGEVARFQALQERLHVKSASAIANFAESQPAAIVLFDLLTLNESSLLSSPWIDRRKHLERLLRRRTSERIRLTESVPGDGAEMLARAQRDGWEGVIAKRTDAVYEPGVRSRNWRKLKVEHRQEFVVGGWTEPRNTREHIGALLLGYFDGDRFVYVGHTGGGFTREGLRTMHRRLAKLERKTSPFERPPRTNERAHWTRPEAVVEVKFNEWTTDGKLRQPIFLGIRDDKDASDVGREPASVQPRRRGRVRVRQTKAGAR